MATGDLQSAERCRDILLYEGKEMTVARPMSAFAVQPIQVPGSFLNCYEVTSPASLAWPVRLYKVVRAELYPRAG